MSSHLLSFLVSRGSARQGHLATSVHSHMGASSASSERVTESETVGWLRLEKPREISGSKGSLGAGRATSEPCPQVPSALWGGQSRTCLENYCTRGLSVTHSALPVPEQKWNLSLHSRLTNRRTAPRVPQTVLRLLRTSGGLADVLQGIVSPGGGW